MKVQIEAGGRKVEIECSDTNVTAKDIAAVAMETWQATEGAKEPSQGPAYGFTPGFGADPPRVVRFEARPLTVNSEVTE